LAHVRTTAGAFVTANVAEQVLGESQVLVTVNVTVTVPPQANGAPGLLLENVALQKITFILYMILAY